MKDVFVEGARGALSIVYDIDHINADDSIEVVVLASNISALFQGWIQELFDRASLYEVAIIDTEVHAIQKINKTDILLTATAWTASQKNAKKYGTGTRFRELKKSSSTCRQKGGAWQCEITASTTS